MTLPTLRYRDGYKYVTDATYAVRVPEMTGHNFELRHKGTDALIASCLDGTLVIPAGYAWDGSSGPGGSWNDTKNSQIGTLVHDVCYQALREGKLPPLARSLADDAMRRLFIAGGMSTIRAWWMWKAVRTFASYAAKQQPAKVLTAP